MKIQSIISIFSAALIIAGCDVAADGRHDVEGKEGKREVVANIGGIMWNLEDPGIEGHGGDNLNAMSRGLEANGESMKEIWVFDCFADSCEMVAKQTDADDNFGVVPMLLSYGHHKLAFVASRGEGSEVDARRGRISWGKVKDTFWAVADVDVSRGSETNINAVLKRVVSRLRITVNDVIPQNVKNVRIAANGWYHAIDVRTGAAVGDMSTESAVSEVSDVSIPPSYVGTSKRLTVSMWTIGHTEQWTQTINIGIYGTDGSTLGEKDCEGVPMLRNMVTNITGYYLTAKPNGNIILDDSWNGTYQYDV